LRLALCATDARNLSVSVNGQPIDSVTGLVPNLTIMRDGIGGYQNPSWPALPRAAALQSQNMKSRSYSRSNLKVTAVAWAAMAASHAGRLQAETRTLQTPHKVRIALVGDSTVTDKAGWELGFKQLLTDQAECLNTAQGGRSSMSFMREGRWTNALALKGDNYFIYQNQLQSHALRRGGQKDCHCQNGSTG
jgi:hypothetical protein